MGEMLEIQQAESSDVWQHKPLTWRGVQMDGERTATVCCSEGHVAYLDHTIDKDGRVTPSLQCPEEGCDFHEHVRLVGWET